jgi:hypothetical protein
MSSILDATTIFYLFLRLLAGFAKYICNNYFAAAFQRQQKSMALKGHCGTVLDIFFILQALLALPAKLRKVFFFSRNSAPRNRLQNRPPIFRGRFPATENSLCKTAIQTFEFRGRTLVIASLPMQVRSSTCVTSIFIM